MIHQNYFDVVKGWDKEMLSPLLFAIFPDDFENYHKTSCVGLKCSSDFVKNTWSNDDNEVLLKLFVKMYADDTILLS